MEKPGNWHRASWDPQFIYWELVMGPAHRLDGHADISRCVMGVWKLQLNRLRHLLQFRPTVGAAFLIPLAVRTSQTFFSTWFFRTNSAINCFSWSFSARRSSTSPLLAWRLLSLVGLDLPGSRSSLLHL